MTRDEAIQALRDELLSVKEYAALTSRHPEYIRHLCRTGQIEHAVRVGKRWRIRFVPRETPPRIDIHAQV